MKKSLRNRKIVPPLQRDSKRSFLRVRLELAKLQKETGNKCAHPACDISGLKLDAHHIIQFAFGGLTKSYNGLLLCDTCHYLFHSFLVPRRFAYAIKQSHWNDSVNFSKINNVSAEELINEIEIALQKTTPVYKKFTLLNEVSIYASFLSDYTSRLHVFVQCLLAKASILNDGTPTVRNSLEKTKRSMNHRRLCSQMLSEKAIGFAEAINDHSSVLSAIHKRAVSYNARGMYPEAVSEFNRAIDCIDNRQISMDGIDSKQLYRARLIREKATCLAKNSPRSSFANKAATESLEIAESIGDVHSINDARVRCCETSIFTNDLGNAEKSISKLYANWSSMNLHLRAITIKMHARFAIAWNDELSAEALIEKGSSIAAINGYHHQAYHFARLKWQLKQSLSSTRNKLLS